MTLKQLRKKLNNAVYQAKEDGDGAASIDMGYKEFMALVDAIEETAYDDGYAKGYGDFSEDATLG